MSAPSALDHPGPVSAATAVAPELLRAEVPVESLEGFTGRSGLRIEAQTVSAGQARKGKSPNLGMATWSNPETSPPSGEATVRLQANPRTADPPLNQQLKLRLARNHAPAS